MADSKQIPCRKTGREARGEERSRRSTSGKTKLANSVFLWSWHWEHPKGELMTVVVSGLGAQFPYPFLSCCQSIATKSWATSAELSCNYSIIKVFPPTYFHFIYIAKQILLKFYPLEKRRVRPIKALQELQTQTGLANKRYFHWYRENLSFKALKHLINATKQNSTGWWKNIVLSKQDQTSNFNSRFCYKTYCLDQNEDLSPAAERVQWIFHK